MAPDSRSHSRLDLACEPSHMRYALAHARDLLPRWGIPRDVVGDAVLIVDELVTNAVRHAGAPATPFAPERGQPTVCQCALVLQLEIGGLVIAVYDQDNGRPALRPVTYDAEDGRGLQLVAGLSEGDWGYAMLAGRPGKLVWARLPVPHGEQQLHPQAQADQPVPSAGLRGSGSPQQRRQPGWQAAVSA